MDCLLLPVVGVLIDSYVIQPGPRGHCHVGFGCSRCVCGVLFSFVVKYIYVHPARFGETRLPSRHAHARLWVSGSGDIASERTSVLGGGNMAILIARS